MAKNDPVPVPVPQEVIVDLQGLREAMAMHYRGGRAPSRTTVHRWMTKLGCPVAGRTQDGRPWFNLPDVVAWWYGAPDRQGASTAPDRA